MVTTDTGNSGKRNFAGGVHPSGHKGLAADSIIEVLPTPATVTIPMSHHIGAPCEALTKPKQELAIGELIGSSKAFISAPIHASVNGVAGMVCSVTLPTGKRVKAVPVKAAENQPDAREVYNDFFKGDYPTSGLEQYVPEAITEAVKSAGITGMGGATFPTFVKFLKNEKKPIDTLLVNGCECEPYLTSDYRLMVEAPLAVLCGALLAARACGARNIVIAIEDNKPLAIDAMRRAAKSTGITIMELPTKYPQGSEKQTILSALGRRVPGGALPLDVGVVVINVGTASTIARAVTRGKPLTHRIVSVTGDGIKHPKNILAPIGASYADLIEHCGGLTDDTARVVSGGPMMGFTVGDLTSPITKGTSGITVLVQQDVEAPPETNCVRCGKCVDACPMNLVPTRIALASRYRQWELTDTYHISSCIECGCCSYVCPANIPLVQLIKTGKALKTKK